MLSIQSSHQLEEAVNDAVAVHLAEKHGRVEFANQVGIPKIADNEGVQGEVGGLDTRPGLLLSN